MLYNRIVLNLLELGPIHIVELKKETLKIRIGKIFRLSKKNKQRFKSGLRRVRLIH